MEKNLNMLSHDGQHWTQYAILSDSQARETVARASARIVATDERGEVVYASNLWDLPSPSAH